LPRSATDTEVTVDLWVTNGWWILVAEGFDAAIRASAERIADSSLLGRRLTAMEFGLRVPCVPAAQGTARTTIFGSIDGSSAGVEASRSLVLPARGVARRGRVRVHPGNDPLRRRGRIPTGIPRDSDVRDRLLVGVLPDVVQRGGTLTLSTPTRHTRRPRSPWFRDFLVEWFARR
jgi:DNA-binding transcriptional LysR family regulator